MSMHIEYQVKQLSVMLGGKSSKKGPKQHMDYRINPKVLPQLGLNKHGRP